MKNYMKILCGLAVTMMLNGCAAETQLIDTENDSTERAAALEGRDFESASNSMIQDMLDLGTLSKPNGQPYILVISRIENDTMQRIDVDELSKSIRIALMKSGKVRVTAFQEDAMVMASGQLRQSKEFNQANVRKSGSLAAPELSLSGKITQREFIVSGKKRIEYRFSLSITDLRNGLTLWEGEEKLKNWQIKMPLLGNLETTYEKILYTLLLLTAFNANAKEIVVTAYGEGDDYDWAVMNAVENAVRQTSDIAIQSDGLHKVDVSTTVKHNASFESEANANDRLNVDIKERDNLLPETKQLGAEENAQIKVKANADETVTARFRDNSKDIMAKYKGSVSSYEVLEHSEENGKHKVKIKAVVFKYDPHDYKSKSLVKKLIIP